ncbi:MAG TPA: cation diffusion facilitator family transporter [Thermomicrobiales bacterium]
MSSAQKPLTRWALVSIVAAVATLGLKFGAYALTGSVGLLSDAVESSVNVVAALTALFALWYATRPVDRSHNYGHQKIELFASAVEGVLILVAAASIGWYAVARLLDPQSLESVGLGSVITLVATAVNFAVARLLLREAAEHDSIVLAADGRHLMTDVWTSLGVLVGILLVQFTGVERLDPLVALLIAANIVRTGVDLLRTAFDGLMDRALPASEVDAVRAAIEAELEPGATFHALRTRRAGSRRFVDLHLLVPGRLSVAQGHELANRIERAVAGALPGAETTVHVEPVEDRAAWRDSALLSLEPPVPIHQRTTRIERGA